MESRFVTTAGEFGRLNGQLLAIRISGRLTIGLTVWSNCDPGTEGTLEDPYLGSIRMVRLDASRARLSPYRWRTRWIAVWSEPVDYEIWMRDVNSREQVFLGSYPDSDSAMAAYTMLDQRRWRKPAFEIKAVERGVSQTADGMP